MFKCSFYDKEVGQLLCTQVMCLNTMTLDWCSVNCEAEYYAAADCSRNEDPRTERPV